jgi:(heptosyl)LPS beta-1,4-glucosyltransferase
VLSVVITTWNEEKNLPQAVASVRGLADEIVVVDTESTDATVAVAKKLGCRVFTHKYPGIVEPVRNFSINQARGDWILLLDADEEVPESLKRQIKSIISSPQADYYRLPRRNLIFGKKIDSAHWWPDYVYRLFRKGFVVWDEAIHSVPLTRGVGADLPPTVESALIHHHYDSISQYVARLNRYTDHQLKLLLDKNTRFSWNLLIAKPIQEFLTQYFARRGYQDGLHGLALSGLQAFSEFVLYLKLWQQTGFTAQKLTPRQTATEIAEQYRQYLWWYYESRIQESSWIMKPFWHLIRSFRTYTFFSYRFKNIVSRIFK